MAPNAARTSNVQPAGKIEFPTLSVYPRFCMDPPTQAPSRAILRERPLSSAQQRIWFLDRLYPGNNGYNMAYACRFTGDLDPDAGIALEVDIAGDVPGIKPHEAPSRMGKGPSLTTYDSSMIPNQPFKELVIKTAEDTQVPLQLSQISRGGTDAGRIHLNRAGCPSVVLGIPTRHIHSHVGLLSLEDVENAIRLTVDLVKKLDSDTVTSFTAL